MSFRRLELIPLLVEWAETIGYPTPTPIQTKAISQVLVGRDIVGCAQTGTSKTTAFILLILQRITGSKVIKTFIVTPLGSLQSLNMRISFCQAKTGPLKWLRKLLTMAVRGVA